MEMSNEAIAKLDGLINSYKQLKESLDSYKAQTDELNTEIKKIMQNNNINVYTTLRGITANLSVQKRESFNDTALIAKLKELGVTSPIKMVEVVDMDELENVIYNNQLDASELTGCKQVKEVAVLKIKEGKHE